MPSDSACSPVRVRARVRARVRGRVKVRVILFCSVVFCSILFSLPHLAIRQRVQPGVGHAGDRDVGELLAQDARVEKAQRVRAHLERMHRT